MAEPFSVFWVNKSAWRKHGPIVSIGFLNALSFAQIGVETHLFVAAGEPSDTKEDIEQFYGGAVLDNLHVHRIDKGAVLVEAFGRNVYRDALKRIRTRLERGERVLTISRELGYLPAAFKLREEFPGKLLVVHEAHDFFADLNKRPDAGSSERRKRWVERRFLPHLDGLLCITEEQEALYQKHLPECPPTLARSLGTRHYPTIDPELRFTRRSLAYIGHLHLEKGLEQMMSCARLLEDHDMTLRIYGGKALHGKMVHDAFEEAGLGHRLFTFPFMSPREMHQKLHEEVGVGLVPLIANFYNRNLTCPVKALDYLSHCIPSVASDLPSTRQVLRGGAIYSRPGDIEDMIRRAAALLSDEKEYKALARGASERRDEMEWGKRALSILEWQGLR